MSKHPPKKTKKNEDMILNIYLNKRPQGPVKIFLLFSLRTQTKTKIKVLETSCSTYVVNIKFYYSCRVSYELPFHTVYLN